MLPRVLFKRLCKRHRIGRIMRSAGNLLQSRDTVQSRASARLFSSQGKYYTGETRLGESYTPSDGIGTGYARAHTHTHVPLSCKIDFPPAVLKFTIKWDNELDAITS